MSYINAAIPQFKLNAYQAGQFKEITTDDLLNKWSVLFFYPADFTFVCPTELGDLQDHYAKLQEMGVNVYGVSHDTHFVHKAWHDTSDTVGKVEYALIGDPNRILSSYLNNVDQDTGLPHRLTIVFNPEGRAQIVETTAEGIGRDAAELVRKIQAAIYVANNPGQVCPAKWKEGAATLAPTLDLVGKI